MNIIIVGAGALGRVVYDFIYAEYNIIACIDDAAPVEGVFENNIPLKKIEEIKQVDLSRIKFILAVLNPEVRESVVKRVLEQRGEFLTHIDQTSFISPSSIIGKGSTFLPYSFIMNKARIGDYVHVHFQSTIGHDVVVGDYCSFAPQCVIGGYAKIGKSVTFGMGVKVLPKVRIGDFATIGAGSVVVKDVPERATAVGNPAKIIIPK